MRLLTDLRIKPIFFGYWTVAAILIGMILSGTASPDNDLSDTSLHQVTPHTHAMVEVDPANSPSVAVRVEPDSITGWNIFLTVENFTFAPEMANQPHVANVGHAHLYLNGIKVARLYGTAYHLADIHEGRHRLTVSLNTNDHADLALNGTPIEASVVITVPPEQAKTVDGTEANLSPPHASIDIQPKG